MHKTTKKRIVLAAFAVCMISTAQAQIRTVAVNVTLADVIGVSPTTPAGANVVNFTYNTAAHYNADQTQEITDQLRVTSTKAYNITVNGTTDFVPGTGTALDLSILRLAARTTGAPSFGAEITPVKASETTLVSNSPATLDQGFDVQYKIPQNASLLTAAKTTYTATIVFTATAI
ncbi:hypothetical protein [Niabella drilacis]|uniref:CS1 type fimbrial major subunit n=1 Tax=Niabella drilacis (strain DSM 25811 / CCM 8410 / CCUG 62505 / LMG 26954 / E90) TaxID=1285928 RepID=A0A1G7BTZ6_NIADE|nr:hypothetical protein [Niabella drilacis]SDE30100.1 hypothetical protein SAMN04487894_1339 [Niabella drilacis]